LIRFQTPSNLAGDNTYIGNVVGGHAVCISLSMIFINLDFGADDIAPDCRFTAN